MHMNKQNKKKKTVIYYLIANVDTTFHINFHYKTNFVFAFSFRQTPIILLIVFFVVAVVVVI